MHIQRLHLSFRQEPFDIGQMLRLEFSVDLLDTRVESHWPVGEV